LLVKILDNCVGNGNEMCIEVFGVADERRGVYDVYERLGGEVACALPFCGCQCTFGLVVLAEF
jgi:hypothetical protein